MRFWGWSEVGRSGAERGGAGRSGVALGEIDAACIVSGGWSVREIELTTSWET